MFSKTYVLLMRVRVGNEKSGSGRVRVGKSNIYGLGVGKNNMYGLGLGKRIQRNLTMRHPPIREFRL